MRKLVFVFICLVSALSCQAETITSGGEGSGIAGADLSNPEVRRAVVAYLKGKSREAKIAAWSKAKKVGWRVRGDSAGTAFELMRIDSGRPIYYITNNVNAAISTGASLIRETAPYNLDGSGTTIGIWDADSVRSTHQEFGSRVNVMDGAASHWHATHVGGTVGAIGIVASAKGMAPNVDIDSYNWDLVESEIASRGASYPGETGKIYLSNHSYAAITGWEIGSYSGNYGVHWFGTWGDREDEGFGQYGYAATWDSICYQVPYHLLIKAAGGASSGENDSAPSEGTTFYYYDGENWQSKSYDSSTDPYDDRWDDGGFDTIPHYSNAKNIMTVSSVSDAVYMGERSLSGVSISSFSGWGPTDDGRIKPDIMANGESLYSSWNNSDTSYNTITGPSMSCANASGSAVLLSQYYGELFVGDAMRASTLKALIIHTADDLGSAGPDYKYGWGLMNVKAGADQIKDHNDFPSENRIAEGRLRPSNPSDSYSFIWDGNSVIRATLCWTDPAAGALMGLDNPSPRLINDLDVRIIDPDGFTVYYPFVMDPANPSVPATTGDNILDNVEQVLIGSPTAPGIYTVEVSYKGGLTNNSQYYSVIIGGQHHIPESAGTVTLDRESYSCGDVLEIELRDGDLLNNGTQDILLTTDGLDSETVTLLENIYKSGIFTGTISTDPNLVTVENGTLQLSDGETITVSYEDADDGTGNPATVTDTAGAECEGPAIFNVQIVAEGPEPTVIFETDEASVGRVLCGLVCEGPYIIEGSDPVWATSHTIKLTGVTAETEYFFIIEANDVLGRTTVDDNLGQCYTFTTDGGARDINVPGEYPTIQQAIDISWDDGTVLVGDGVYTGGGNRDIDFRGKAITVRSENGPEGCTIDCEGSGRGFYLHSGEDTNSVISGFTITNGYVSENGGGIYCKDSAVKIIDCIIIGCETGGQGGAICFEGGGGKIVNSIMSANTSQAEGGAVYSDGCDPEILNCTVVGNSASVGGGYYCVNGNGVVKNSIFRDNLGGQITGALGPDEPVVEYSDVQGGSFGEGNIDLDPCFVDAAAGDYHLRWDSLCIDGGDPAFVGEPNDKDTDGEPRLMGGRVDMGADEVGEKQADFTRDGAIDSDDLKLFVQLWLTSPSDYDWYVLCDLQENEQIDFADFNKLAEDWLWRAVWYGW